MTAAGRLSLQGSVPLGDYPVAVAWTAGGRALWVGLADGSLCWVPPEEPAALRRLGATHPGGVLAVACQRAGRLAASSGQDGSVLLWDLGSFESRRLLHAPQWSEHLAFSEDGRWLAVATGRTLRLFDAHASWGPGSPVQVSPQYQHTASAGAIAALDWRPRGRELAAAGNGAVRLHQPPPQGAVREYRCGAPV